MAARAKVWAALAACLLLLPGAMVQEPPVMPVDPARVIDADFLRNRDPARWDGLSVQRIAFTEGRARWHVWRIANQARRDGPLWVVPHDNENAAFDAALNAVRAWGGVAMIVDSGIDDDTHMARYNHDVTDGRPIDPNRNFYDALPIYAATILADLGAPPRLIVALHTNEPGFDPNLSDCPPIGPAGAGEIAVGLCNARYHPRSSVARRWPFDDDDSLAVVPYLSGRDPRGAFCANRLIRRDFNILFEQVARSDGSLSNYAVQHGLRYINFETEDRGNSVAGVAASRDRLVTMIDTMMEACGDVPQVRLAARR